MIRSVNFETMLMNNPVLFSFDSSTRTKNKLSLDLQNDAAEVFSHGAQVEKN